jgi:ATP-binding cassette subfamily B (MDR/TAP) protein 1
MIELLYKPIFPCEDGVFVPEGFESCQDYWDFSAGEMRDLSHTVTYWLIGIMASALVGHTLVHYGFGTAVERMNKRVRDAAFKNLVRQEVAWFDVRQVATITTQLSDDAALIHSFSGEPIRTLVMNLSSVAVGLVVSFVFMWPFALLTLGTLPFMAFGAEAEMQMYMGEDEGDVHAADDQNSAGSIVVESLLNIRTVASLSLEESRKKQFSEAMQHEDPTPLKTNAIKGSTSGLGQFVQMWGVALMFWWGGFLLDRHPGLWDLRDFLISMFSLLFSLSGMGIAMQVCFAGCLIIFYTFCPSSKVLTSILFSRALPTATEPKQQQTVFSISLSEKAKSILSRRVERRISS